MRKHLLCTFEDLHLNCQNLQLANTYSPSAPAVRWDTETVESRSSWASQPVLHSEQNEKSWSQPRWKMG